MAEQYLHGGQEGKAWVVPGLSGPPLWKREPGGRVSLGLWAGPRKKSVPSQAHSGSHHVGLESPRSTRALEACAVRRSHGSELCHHAAGFGVSLYGLEDPLPEVTDFGVDTWLLSQGTAGAPAHDATQPPTWRPRDGVLTHEGATTVTLAGIDATLRVTGTEHLGLDLVPVEVGAIADIIADNGDSGLLEHPSLLAVVLRVAPACHGTQLAIHQGLTGSREAYRLDVLCEGQGAGEVDQGDVIAVLLAAGVSEGEIAPMVDYCLHAQLQAVG